MDLRIVKTCLHLSATRLTQKRSHAQRSFSSSSFLNGPAWMREEKTTMRMMMMATS